MTRPWSPAEIAGAKALGGNDDAQLGDLIDARTVLDAAAAAQQAKLVEMGYPSAQVSGAGTGEQQ